MKIIRNQKLQITINLRGVRYCLKEKDDGAEETDEKEVIDASRKKDDLKRLQLLLALRQ